MRVQNPVLAEEGVEEEHPIVWPRMYSDECSGTGEVEEPAFRRPEVPLRANLQGQCGHADDHARDPDEPPPARRRSEPQSDPVEPRTREERSSGFAIEDIAVNEE